MMLTKKQADLTLAYKLVQEAGAKTDRDAGHVSRYVRRTPTRSLGSASSSLFKLSMPLTVQNRSSF